MACDLYCCLLPQCEALRTCRSGFPIATTQQPVSNKTAQIFLLRKVSYFKNRNALMKLEICNPSKWPSENMYGVCHWWKMQLLTVGTDFSKIRWAIIIGTDFCSDLLCSIYVCGVINMTSANNRQVVHEAFSCTWHALTNNRRVKQWINCTVNWKKKPSACNVYIGG